ncbi:MAG: CHASE2 domain-containing protein [Caulobacter sp.]|nr:CHASE2 domain-containing protein [Caulobacter sp.]
MKQPLEEPWWKRALIVGFAGLLFSLCMAFLISIGSSLRIAPFVAIERAGVDLGQRTYVAFAPWLDPSFQSGAGASYAFIDVDAEACRRFSPDPDDCLTDRPIPTALITDFARAAALSGARVVIIDVAPPEDLAERNSLLAALSRPTGPYFIAPLRSRPDLSGGTLAQRLDRQGSLTPRLAQGRLRLAPIATSADIGAGDGVIRHFPLLTPIREGQGQPDRWLPSAPFLAAMLAQPDTARAVDCRFYGAVATGCATAAQSSLMDSAVALGRDPALRNRIQYSLPSLAALAPQNEVRLRSRYLGRYDRYPASGLLDETGFAIPEGVLTDRIVVLGSSQTQGNDWHATPLGAMTGSEIVLNATRALIEFSPLSEGTGASPPARQLLQGLTAFLAKLKGIGLGALIMTLCWLTIFGLNDRMKRRGRLSGLLSVLLFFGFIGALFVLEVFAGLGALRGARGPVQAVDLLTPVVALGLEGFAEAARSFTHQAEALGQKLLNRITGQAVAALPTQEP